MGKAGKALSAFIDNIPDKHLEGLAGKAGTTYKDQDFRLDIQGLTSDSPQKYNLQIQINWETSISTLRKSAPKSVSIVLAPTENPWTAGQIRAEFHANSTDFSTNTIV